MTEVRTRSRPDRASRGRDNQPGRLDLPSKRSTARWVPSRRLRIREELHRRGLSLAALNDLIVLWRRRERAVPDGLKREQTRAELADLRAVANALAGRRVWSSEVARGIETFDTLAVGVRLPGEAVADLRLAVRSDLGQHPRPVLLALGDQGRLFVEDVIDGRVLVVASSDRLPPRERAQLPPV